MLRQGAGALKEVSWLSRDRSALSLPALLPLTYEWVGRQGAAVEVSFTEGKVKQEGGVGPLPQSPSTGNPVGGVAAFWEMGVWVHVWTCWPVGATPTLWTAGWSADKQRQFSESWGATDKTDKHLLVAGRWWEEA